MTGTFSFPSLKQERMKFRAPWTRTKSLFSSKRSLTITASTIWIVWRRYQTLTRMSCPIETSMMILTESTNLTCHSKHSFSKPTFGYRFKRSIDLLNIYLSKLYFWFNNLFVPAKIQISGSLPGKLTKIKPKFSYLKKILSFLKNHNL